MLVFHAAELADGNALARGLQLFVRRCLPPLPASLTLCSSFMCGGHGAVFGHVLLGFFSTFFCYRKRSGLRKQNEHQEALFRISLGVRVKDKRS